MKVDTLVIGAGPAGLTAAQQLQLAGRTDVLVLEASEHVGGISKTVSHNGNRIDIGGHRFFSKSDWVMDWWRSMLPIARPEDVLDEVDFRLRYQGAQRLLGRDAVSACEKDAEVMLLRNRLSRIYWGGKFFDYPLKPGLDMARKLGPARCLRIGSSYARSSVFPIRPELTLEQFLTNRFGRELYLTFFKEYTEKVWGVPCSEISAEWGAQRIKSLSIAEALKHAARKALGGDRKVEATSLIEHFLYPKLGPGQMWEVVARKLQLGGLRLMHGLTVNGIEREGSCIRAVRARDAEGHTLRVEANHVISTMPIKDLVAAFDEGPGAELDDIAAGLQYRDFFTVGLLYRRLAPSLGSGLKDNWIYIQEPGVKVGRLQVFNNWSPYMVADPTTWWLGLEFFARDDDALWAMEDGALKELAVREMQHLRLAEPKDVIDATVLRMPKAYPGYFGDAYSRFGKLREWLDALNNLYLVGRNGMHRYNNQDHSMLSARAAVQVLLQGGGSRAPIWSINVDDDYHER